MQHILQNKCIKVICIETNNIELKVGQQYEVERIDYMGGMEWYVIKDESGENYLYPPTWFTIVS